MRWLRAIWRNFSVLDWFALGLALIGCGVAVIGLVTGEMLWVAIAWVFIVPAQIVAVIQVRRNGVYYRFEPRPISIRTMRLIFAVGFIATALLLLALIWIAG